MPDNTPLHPVVDIASLIMRLQAIEARIVELENARNMKSAMGVAECLERFYERAQPHWASDEK